MTIEEEKKKKTQTMNRKCRTQTPRLELAMEEEDLDFADGAFLLPVTEADLLMRIREYRRESSLTNDSINSSNDSISGKKWGSFAIKERIGMDSNGNLNWAGSLSRDTEPSKHSGSVDRSLKVERAKSIEPVPPPPKKENTPPKKEPIKQAKFTNSLNKNHIKESLAALKASMSKSVEALDSQQQATAEESAKPSAEQSKQPVEENLVSPQIDKPSGLFIKVSDRESPKPFLTEAQVKELQKMKLKQQTPPPPPPPPSQLKQEKPLPGKLDLSFLEPKLSEEPKKEPIKVSKRLARDSKFDADEEDESTSWSYYNMSYDKSERLAPITREKLKDTILIEGTTLTLECKIDGNPTPRIFWYHNNQIVHGNDGRVKLSHTTDGKLVCTISNANKSDMGK